MYKKQLSSVNRSYVLLKCGKFLLQGLLVWEHGSQLVEHVLQSLHHACLQIIQLSLAHLRGKLTNDLGLIPIVRTFMIVKVFAEFGHFRFEVFRDAGAGAKATTTVPGTHTTTTLQSLDLFIKHGNLLGQTDDLITVFRSFSIQWLNFVVN